MFLFVGLILVATATSCKKDKNKDCVAPALDKNIIGQWESKDATGSKSTLEFKADGTYTDPDDAIVGGSSGGVNYTEKTYEVLSESQIKFTASAPAGSSGHVSTTLDVKDNQCDKIELNLSGFGSLGDITLTRK